MRKNSKAWVAVQLTCGHETDTGIQEAWDKLVFCVDCRESRHVAKVWEYVTIICRTCRYRTNRSGWDGKERGLKCISNHANRYTDHVVQLWEKGHLVRTLTMSRIQPELALEWDDEPPPF